MGEQTGISWCHHTFNPWSGCQKVSPGCRFCYAERDTQRWGKELFGPKNEREQRAEGYWKQLHKWNADAIAAGERRRVFLMSFGDFWEDLPQLEAPRKRTLGLIEECRALDFLILTKRPEDAPRLLAEAGYDRWMMQGWPANVWAMTSAENGLYLNERLPHLLALPARVRGLSCEPLLGYLYDLRKWLQTGEVHWAIFGGESGPKARPMHPDWAVNGRVECMDHKVAMWWKQWGKWVPDGLETKGLLQLEPGQPVQPGFSVVALNDGNGDLVRMKATPYTEGDLRGYCDRQLPATRLMEVEW